MGFGPINKKLVTRLVVLGLLTSVSTLAVAVSTADVTLAGGYWYWAVAVWIPTYFILYWYPRWS